MPLRRGLQLTGVWSLYNMVLKLNLLLVVLSLVAMATAWRCGSSGRPGNWKLLDMTHVLNNRTLTTRFVDYLQLYTTFRGERQTPDGETFWYEQYRFCASDNSGTHIDAPSHFHQDVNTIDEIPLEQLVDIPVAKIDVSEKVRANNEYNLAVEDVMSWERKYGRIPRNSFVFMYSGYGKFYGDRLAFLGTEEEDQMQFQFPSFSTEVIEWLLSERSINGVGTETYSLENVQGIRERTFYVHRLLAQANKFGFESIANMDKLPEYGACVTALPMKLDGGSGAPTRVVAKFNPDPPSPPTDGASGLNSQIVVFLLLCACAIA